MLATIGRSLAGQRQACTAGNRPAAHTRLRPVAVWTRPTPDRNEDWTKPSYIPTPGQSPVVEPYRRDDQPLYTPSAPEFTPAERPEQAPEMPKGPSMPERRPDPIPAGTPKEKPPTGEPAKEAPPEAPKQK